MSILLVVSYLCLFCYEFSVQKEFESRDYVMRTIVKNRSHSLNILFEYAKWRSSGIDINREKIDSLKADFENIYDLYFQNCGIRSMEDYFHFKKYDLLFDIPAQGNCKSLIDQNNILDSFMLPIDEMIQEISAKNKTGEEENSFIAIMNRELEYSMNDSYALELQALGVLKNNYSPYKFAIEINGMVDTILSFPYMLSEKPDSFRLFRSWQDDETLEWTTKIESFNTQLDIL